MSLQLIWRRDTSLPWTLYHSDATGNDIIADPDHFGAVGDLKEKYFTD